ncbi:uncharacterized protein LOC142322936 [Lycorma delicatula]|uniref:uncharacterized protein LOC142322936 n=1 Tax=Lycorma delicatula TaxID=130591 RepID=UPI003F51191B
MVTPVHRFQPIECVTGQYSHNHGNRRNNSGGELPVRSHAVELDSSVFLDLPLDGSTEATGHQPPQIEPVNKHNNCGMKLSFAVVTAIIGGVRLYFQNQGIEIIYSLAFIVLVTFCAITMYRSMTRHNIFSSSAATATVSSARVPPQPSIIAQVRVTSVEETPPPAPPPPLIEPPPPPYDIAILLPQQIRQEDIPPPSYEKAVS